jgi:plasmid stabilization system protein ParE
VRFVWSSAAKVEPATQIRYIVKFNREIVILHVYHGRQDWQ